MPTSPRSIAPPSSLPASPCPGPTSPRHVLPPCSASMSGSASGIDVPLRRSFSMPRLRIPPSGPTSTPCRHLPSPGPGPGSFTASHGRVPPPHPISPARFRPSLSRRTSPCPFSVNRHVQRFRHVPSLARFPIPLATMHGASRQDHAMSGFHDHGLRPPGAPKPPHRLPHASCPGSAANASLAPRGAPSKSPPARPTPCDMSSTSGSVAPRRRHPPRDHMDRAVHRPRGQQMAWSMLVSRGLLLDGKNLQLEIPPTAAICPCWHR